MRMYTTLLVLGVPAAWLGGLNGAKIALCGLLAGAVVENVLSARIRSMTGDRTQAMVLLVSAIVFSGFLVWLVVRLLQGAFGYPQ